MKNLYSLIVVAAISSFATFGVMGLVEDPNTTQKNKVTSANVDYEGVNVRVYKNGKKVAETHNALMEGNLSIEKEIRQKGTDYNWSTISVGNGTAPTTGDGSLDSEWASGQCGLGPIGASIDTDVNKDGKWNLTATWDSITCDDVIVNTTAQKSQSAPSSYDYFAGADLGRDINLYSGDQLTVEWSNEVS